MAFTLRWRNDNTKPVVVRIYRSTTVIDPTKLPAALATLSNGETEWTDTTAFYGVTYYYFTTVTNPTTGKTVNGVNTPYTNEQRRGVGPNTLQFGTDMLGFYGDVVYDDQFPLGGFQQKVQDLLLSVSSTFTAAYRFPVSKYARNGKILYIPSSPISSGLSWAALYAAGMVYGTDDAGPENGRGSLTAAVQDASCVWKGDKYRIRLMRGLSESPNTPAFAFDAKYNGVTHDASDLTGFNEFNDLFYSTQYFFPAKRRTDGYRFAAPFTTTNSNYADGYLTMEHDTASNNILTRGTITSPMSADLLTTIRYRGHGSVVTAWVPVFELVEDY
ncbi:putative virion structural protein [Erwinia phage vB_EamM_Kwan]|uniref:Putative virion structural protein n=1 Tax=Erwinia phage vB_EamM_Kwan TaxID=1883374 RepID=A0A1B2IE51_9CAUD|nr:putative virion structural protein [Erwinia phage vB_EamM_Kwan]ANZ49522.1 putative virion structural protein [Erwinia phage vB_EamM_Kwan]